MQQVAAKSSDIAALPIEVNTTTTNGDSESSVFADLLQQSKHALNTSTKRKESNIPEQEKISETAEEVKASVKKSGKVSVEPDKLVDTKDEQASSRPADDANVSRPSRDETESSHRNTVPVKPVPLSVDTQRDADILNLHDVDFESEITRIDEQSRYFTTIPDVPPVNVSDSEQAVIDGGVSNVADDVLSLIGYAEKIQPNSGSEIQTREANVIERADSTQSSDLASTPNPTETLEAASNANPDENIEALNGLANKLSVILEAEPTDVTSISEALLRYKQTPSPDLPRVEEVGVKSANTLDNASRESVVSSETELTVSLEASGIAITDNTSQEHTDVLTGIAKLINRAISPETKADADGTDVLDNESVGSQLAIDVELVKQVLNQESSRYVSQPEVPTSGESYLSTAPNSGVQIEETHSTSSVELAFGLQSEPVQAATIQRITESVVAVVPNATPQLQEQVKGALSSAVAEISAQIEQGHEPAINLDDVIAQTLVENGVNVTPQITAHIEQQISQSQGFLNLAQQIADARYTLDSNTGADVSVSETTRLQVENQHTQQQTQASEKPAAFQTPEGKQQITEKIRWMVNARQSMAEIRLDPPEMGSMQVRVNVSGEAASVNFVVQSAAARDAIADAMPKLRDMLSEQGIELGEAFVQQQDRQAHDGQDQNQGFAGTVNEAFDYEEEDVNVIEQPVTRQLQGGVDAYV